VSLTGNWCARFGDNKGILVNEVCELKTQLYTLRRYNEIIKTYAQKVKGISDKLVALQHPVNDDDLVEFIITGLGPTYRPFTRSLESRQEDIF